MRQELDRADGRQALLAAVVQSSHDAIISKDSKGIILTWNPAAEELYGYSAGEAIGRHISFIVPPELRENQLEDIMAQLPTLAGTRRFETERLNNKGERIEVEVRISPIRNSRGELLGASSIAHDIGERKQIEREFARWRDELAKSNAELERFAYVASHDLQEPLRMVASYVQLLKQRYQGRLDSDADEFIAYAVDGANRMKTMIADLLKYSRAGQGDAFEIIDSGVALNHALANLQFVIEEVGATVTRGRMPRVRGIEAQLAVLFQNLLGNALKFHRIVPPRIEIGAERAAGAWQFSITDNGIGIAPEYKDKIFEVFRRLHSREKYPGTGIGLTICRKIVAHHGGQIWVESDEGKGATFRFTLPDDPARLASTSDPHATD